MEIVRIDKNTVAIHEMDAFFVGLIRMIPDAADPRESKAAEERLYSNPMEKHSKDPLNEEWKQYVEPELRHLFQTSNDTVAEDLKRITETQHKGDVAYRLEIPIENLNRWLNSLNQARLSLAAREEFTEVDLDGEISPIINSKRDMSLLQIHFYGFLQEIFIRELTRS